MTNLEIDAKVRVLVKTERKITREILELIVLAEGQRLPEERGFRDTHRWLIESHGYSGPAANRRVQAARLLRDLPDIGSKIQQGALNLTVLWRAQKTFEAQRKIAKVTREQKREAISKIENKTDEQAERELDALFPDAVTSNEKTTYRRNGGQSLLVQLTEEEAKELERSRQLLSHAFPGATHGAVIARLAKEYNDRKDPLRKPAPTPRRGNVRRTIITEAEGRCTYQDPVTGRTCGSPIRPEADHIIPKAKGGTNEPSNLRCYCKRHNQYAAEKSFGREFMERRRGN